jgi:hypothetical protein
VPSDCVAATARDAFERSLERRILERLDLPAVVADEVVVMVAACMRGLEPRDAVAEIDPLDESELVQALEDAIDARHPDPRRRGAQALVDFLSGHAAVLRSEKLDDGSTCSTAATAHGPET